MRTSNWELFWDLLHQLGTIALIIFIMLAVYRKEWQEGTMWLVWLIYDRMPKDKS